MKLKLDSNSKFAIMVVIIVLVIYASSNRTSEPYSSEVNKTNETSGNQTIDPPEEDPLPDEPPAKLIGFDVQVDL